MGRGNIHKILVEIPEGKRPFGELSVGEKIILKEF
jgi:hypothetical protein